MRPHSLLAVLAVLAVVALSTASARADAVADFYKGKTIRIIIGAGIGGSYGVYGTLVSRHLGRFIPGAPTLIVQSMPAANGLVALNYLGGQAPRDGTVISVIHVTLVQAGLFNPKATYDTARFQWIGRFSSLAFVGFTSQKSGIRTVQDAMKREVAAGVPGLNSVPGQMPLVLNKIAGTRFKTISGYTGTGQTFIALERGEVEFAATSMDTVRALHWDKVKSGQLVPLFAQAGSRLKAFPDTPVLLEFGRDDMEKAFLGVFSIAAEIGRSLATTPDVPGERLAALRAAFDKMLADPQFQAEVAKLRLEFDPVSGAELHRLVAASLTMSPPTLEKARAFHDDLFK